MRGVWSREALHRPVHWESLHWQIRGKVEAGKGEDSQNDGRYKLTVTFMDLNVSEQTSLLNVIQTI